MRGEMVSERKRSKKHKTLSIGIRSLRFRIEVDTLAEVGCTLLICEVASQKLGRKEYIKSIRN